jgi:DNA primase
MNDGDRAGIRASVRAADELLVVGLESSVVILPEGEDPDSFIRKKGAEELRAEMRSAPNYFGWLKGQALGGSRTTFRTGEVIKHLLQAVSAVTDSVRQELYLQEISKLFEMPVSSLRPGLGKPGRPEKAAVESPREETRRERFQKQVFRIGLEEERFARMIVENLDIGELEGAPYMDYYKALDSAVKNHIDTGSSAFTAGIEDPDLGRLATEIALMPLPPGPIDRFLADTITRLKEQAVKDELETMKKRLRLIESGAGKPAAGEIEEITRAYQELSMKLKSLRLQGGHSD